MTAVRENIPVIAVVFQNYEWGAEKKNQIDYYDNRFVGANLRENPSYAQLAKDMGAEGYRVEDYTTVRDVVARPWPRPSHGHRVGRRRWQEGSGRAFPAGRPADAGAATCPSTPIQRQEMRPSRTPGQVPPAAGRAAGRCGDA
jgi:hypothetical protein